MMFFPHKIQVSNSPIYLGLLEILLCFRMWFLWTHSPSQSVSGSCWINRYQKVQPFLDVLHGLSVSWVTSPCLQHASWLLIYLFLLVCSPSYSYVLEPISCSSQTACFFGFSSFSIFWFLFFFFFCGWTFQHFPVSFWLVVFFPRVIPFPAAIDQDWLGHGYLWRPVPAELWADADWKMENAAGNVTWQWGGISSQKMGVNQAEMIEVMMV